MIVLLRLVIIAITASCPPPGFSSSWSPS